MYSSPADAALAKEWSDSVEIPSIWRLGAILPGESGAREALREDGLKAVAKPSYCSGDQIPRAAHEKIAADLAYHINVPVPATCLWTDQATGKDYSISSWAFPECETWVGASRLGIIDNPYIQSARRLISVGSVFHTWIANGDAHGQNVLINTRANVANPEIAFIDHAFALSYVWSAGNETLRKASTDYCGPLTLDTGAVSQTAVKIQALEQPLISDIVSRIPDRYLPSDRREIIIRNLLRRRLQLAGLFGVV